MQGRRGGAQGLIEPCRIVLTIACAREETPNFRFTFST
jgi:hypothetical protein